VAGGRDRFGPALYLGGGLALVGAAGYAFVALTGHTLPPADAAAAASLYLLVNIIGPGIFAALEQETSRSVSAEIAAGRDPRPVTRNASILAGALLVGVVAVLLAISPVLTNKALAGKWGLFAAVLLSVVTSAAVYAVRGLVGGRQRFTGYAATLGAEGVARIVPCIVIAASGAPNAVTFAIAFAAGSAFGALAGLPWLRRPVELPEVRKSTAPASAGRMARALSFLVGGTLLMLLAMNLAPIVVTPRLGADAATAAAFASAFVLARVPLFLFAPVQAVLLPSLTRAATRGELGVVRARLRAILLAVAAIGLAGVLASFTVGPWAVQVLFGAEVRLSGAVVGLLGVSTVGLMVAQVLQPGLVALGRHKIVTLAWAAGTVALVALLALPGDPLRAGVAGQLVASALVVAVMLTSLYRVLGASRSGRSAKGVDPVSGDENVIKQ
jgi:O-antigen/teichoic acid export membrane protein